MADEYLHLSFSILLTLLALGGKGFPELKEWALAWLQRIRELYQLNRERLLYEPDTGERTAADSTLKQHVATMVAQRDSELADSKPREPCRQVLQSLTEHWDGLTRFVNDSCIPMDNNYGERLIRGPAVGRKNYYGSGAEWSGRMAMMLFSIFATLSLWKINPRNWLNGYFAACANSAGKAPADVAEFLPWYLSLEQLKDLQISNTAQKNSANSKASDSTVNSS